MRAVPVALFLLALLFAGLFSGCSGEVSVDQKFVNLFVELRVAELSYGKDSPQSRLVRQDALKAAGYTREQFLARTDEILNDERQWVPFQKAVNARIDSLLAPPPETAQAPGEAPATDPLSPIKKLQLEKKLQSQMPARKGGVH